MVRSVACLAVLVLFLPLKVFSEGPTPAGNGACLQAIDDTFAKAKAVHNTVEGMNLYKRSLDKALKALEERPEDYELLWRAVYAAHKYGQTARNIQVPDWKAICREWGSKGMELAERAEAVRPDRVEAYFLQTACIGIYSDVTGPITAIREGFFEKSKTAMHKAYAIDRTYRDYAPVFGLAMFYVTPPFPLRDKKKALHYFEEFEKNTTWTVEPYTRSVYAAKLLMTAKPKAWRERARKMLDRALSDPLPRKFLQDWAHELQEDLE